MSFIIEGEIKIFHDKQKLTQFMPTKSELQKLLKEILNTEDEDKHTHESMGVNKFHEISR
jgi:cytochrome b